MSVTDPRVQREPVIGWRVWWLLYSHQLKSYSAPYVWTPGRNQANCEAPVYRCTDEAECAQPVHRCPEAPGANCDCGFWGLWDWRQAALTSRTCGVLGLIAGWGQVAIHGDEGFRAQYARVLGLFTDHIADLNKLPRWGAAHRGEMVRATASDYQVPALSLHAAARRGVLAELGVPAPAIRQIAIRVPPPPPERKSDGLGDRYRLWYQSERGGTRASLEAER